MKRLLFATLCVLSFSAAARAQTILPDAVSGQPYSFQISTNPPQPSGTVYAVDTLPIGLSINASSGLISGTTTAVGTYKGNLSLRSNSNTTTFPYQITVDPAAGAPTITSNGTIPGTVGVALSYTISATNGPTSFNVAQLPPGLTSSGGVISGTPTTPGLFFTSISANNGSGQGAILVLQFTISPAGAVPVVTSGLVVSNPVGAPFSYTIAATNNPTSFAAAGLPAGLTLNTATGVISGTPTTPAVSTVALTAANSFGSGLPVNLSLTIGNFSSITSPAAISATIGVPLAYTLTASNTPFTYTVTGLPAGLTLNSNTGTITGTPTVAGIYTLNASANNALGTGAVLPLTLTISGGSPTPPSILVQPVSQAGTIGSAVRFSVGATGAGALSYQWSLNNNPISGQNAPTLTIGSVQATDAGAYTVTVTNSVGTTVSAPANLSILSLLVPPTIVSQPSKGIATVGNSATLTVGASGSVPLSYQWQLNGAAITGATTATLVLPSVRVTDGGNYTVIVSNAAGSATSLPAALTVSATPVAPIFQFQPNPATVGLGGTASFSVGVVGSTPITYQWSKNGAAIAGATSSGLTFPNVKATDAGSYSVVIGNPGGTVTSSAASLTVSPAGGAPVPITIAIQPNPTVVNVGSSATLTVGATGDAAVTYQWRKNQAPIPGGTNSSFSISDVQLADAGIYDVLVANGFSATYSFPTPLTVTPVTVPSRLTNVSVSGFTGLADQKMAIGFIIGGTGAKPTLVRAIGPTLANFGVTGLLADPQLTVISASTNQSVASNDNWGGGPALATLFLQTGAFSLPAASLDAAVSANLQAGAYSALVSGAANGTGAVLLEAYDADSSQAPTSHFVNVSARGLAGTGANVLTIGFVITGTTNKTLLIRGVGPTLASYSVAGAVSDPQLNVFDVGRNLVGSNDDWGGAATLTAAFNAVSAFPLPTTSKDAALLVTLAPGAYTAQLSTNGTPGVGLLEMYEMP